MLWVSLAWHSAALCVSDWAPGLFPSLGVPLNKQQGCCWEEASLGYPEFMVLARLIGSRRKKFFVRMQLAGKARVMCPAPGLCLWSFSSCREESQRKNGKSYVQAACGVVQTSNLSNLSWVQVLLNRNPKAGEAPRSPSKLFLAGRDIFCSLN